MCERFSTLRCKEVINVCDGSRLGFVSDLELEDGHVTALLVPCPGKLFGLLKSGEFFVIGWSCIRRIGGDIILVDVDPAGCRRPCRQKGFFSQK